MYERLTWTRGFQAKNLTFGMNRFRKDLNLSMSLICNWCIPCMYHRETNKVSKHPERWNWPPGGLWRLDKLWKWLAEGEFVVYQQGATLHCSYKWSRSSRPNQFAYSTHHLSWKCNLPNAAHICASWRRRGCPVRSWSHDSHRVLKWSSSENNVEVFVVDGTPRALSVWSKIPKIPVRG